MAQKMSKKQRKQEAARQRAEAEAAAIASPFPTWVNMLLLIGVSFFAGFVVAAFIFGQGPTKTTSSAANLFTHDEVQQTLAASVPLNAPGDIDHSTAHLTADGDPALGVKDAPVTIVEYSDFSCGFCARFYNDTLHQILNTYGDDVEFVYRDAPVLGSFEAAHAAECANVQGKFWEYHDYLFANRGSYDAQTFAAIAGTLGLDVDAFKICLDEDATIAEVQDDFDTAQTLGVSGTPSFTVNGELVVGAKPFAEFRAIIDAALEAADN